MTTVVVGGALANKPRNGGEAWVRLSWVRGLQQLGLDVRLVEELAGTAEEQTGSDAVAYFREVTAAFGLQDRATLLVGDEALVGPGLAGLQDLAGDATLVNISGHLASPRLFPRFRSRVLVDIDPGYTQVWHAAGDPGARVAGHDRHFTIGENIGTPGCPVPTAGVRWRPVRQPVVLADWPVTPGHSEPARFTTVASWRGGYGPVEHDGTTYGVKAHEFRKVLELPQRTSHPFEVALDIHPGDGRDLDALHAHGWSTVEPAAVAAGPLAFRDYVLGSAAEFSVAQGLYVGMGTGWFSDRTTRYLAAGKPALVQETGFRRHLPVGEGLLSFRTLEEAAAGAEAILGDYDRHSEAARTVAVEQFGSDRVLARFCDEAGIR